MRDFWKRVPWWKLSLMVWLDAIGLTMVLLFVLTSLRKGWLSEGSLFVADAIGSIAVGAAASMIVWRRR